MASSSSNNRAARTDRSPESYESLRKRQMAAAVLQSYEKLSWFSTMRHESLQQTRLHFQNVVAGFTSDDEAGLIDVPLDNAAAAAAAASSRSAEDDKRRRVSKGKERASISTDSPIAEGSPRDRSRPSPASRSSDASKKKRKNPTQS